MGRDNMVEKGKEEYLYSAFSHQGTYKALRHGSHSFTCKQHHACLWCDSTKIFNLHWEWVVIYVFVFMLSLHWFIFYWRCNKHNKTQIVTLLVYCTIISDNIVVIMRLRKT